MGDAFFVRMCDDEEDNEEEERDEEEIGHCPNCGGAGQVGLECTKYKDSSVIYKNKYGIYCQPEMLNAQATTTTTQPRIMELLVMTKLCKENNKLTEKERKQDWSMDGA